MTEHSVDLLIHTLKLGMILWALCYTGKITVVLGIGMANAKADELRIMSGAVNRAEDLIKFMRQDVKDKSEAKAKAPAPGVDQ